MFRKIPRVFDQDGLRVLRHAVDRVRLFTWWASGKERAFGRFNRAIDYSYEQLEHRLLLSVTFNPGPGPNWLEQGPRPTVDAALFVPAHPDAGAVESIAINPNNLSQIYVGTVNGGIWRTDNADPSNPGATTWRPLTDQQRSLAMGDIAFSPFDREGNTLFAGTGSFSSLRQEGGPAIGILRTTDGGDTWLNFPLTPGVSNQIKVVLPTAIDLDPTPGVQELVLVGTVGGGGLFRSNDNGHTNVSISGSNGLPAGDISQLIVDPNNSQRFYAGVPNRGVFRGDYVPGDNDPGKINWTPVNTGIADINDTNITAAGNVQIAGRDSGGTTVLFALLSGSHQGAFRSTNGGDSWTRLATPPELFQNNGTSQTGNTIVVDPTNDQVAYIATYGGADQTFRYNPTGQGRWDAIASAGAQAAQNGGSNPHADARDLAFQGTTVLVEATDGGISFLQNPLTAGKGVWGSFVGETATGQALGVIEVHDIAWDSNSDVIVAASQDNGTSYQIARDNKVWTTLSGGDGGNVVVDNFTLAGADQSIRYFSAESLTGFRRQVFDAKNNPVGGEVRLIGDRTLEGFTAADFVPLFEINAIRPPAGQSTRIAIGGTAVYEADNAGIAADPKSVNWRRVTTGPGFVFASAMAYGGQRNGVPEPDVLYVGSGGDVFVRTPGGTLTRTMVQFPGDKVTDIALDPTDWQHAFVISSTGVWETTEAGANWIPRTGTLANLASDLRTVEYFDGGAVDAVLVGGLGGVFRMITNNPGVWTEFGAGMPNAVTYDLRYDATDDVLLAGTLGRGAWTIGNASRTLTVPNVLQIDGDTDFAGEDDTIRLIREAGNPALLDVFLNSATPALTVPLSALGQINVNGLGGDDTLIVDSSNGLIVLPPTSFGFPVPIQFDGGGGTDALQVVQSGGDLQTTDSYTFPSVTDPTGLGANLIIGMSGTQHVRFKNVESISDLVPARSLTISGLRDQPNTITRSEGSVPVNDKVIVAGEPPIEFSDKAQLTILGTGFHGDTFNLTPSANVPILVDGGSIIDGPSQGTGVDTLNVNGEGLNYGLTGTRVTEEGGERKAVDYVRIEALGLSSGTFAVSGDVPPNVTVNDTATLKGDGTILGVLAVNFGGTVAPGLSPGILATGSVTFSPGSTFSVELNGTAAGTEHDQLAVTGAVDLGGATLVTTLGYTPTGGDRLVILANDDSDPVIGTFNGLPEGAALDVDGRPFRISYQGGDGNDVVLIAGRTAVAVAGFTLINAKTDEPIMSLTEGATLDLATLPAQLSVQANTTPATVGSVRFALDGNANFRTDNIFPYALFGDRGGDFNAGTLTAGPHTLTATPFTGSRATGTPGGALTVHFDVVNSAAVTGFTLINARTDQPIMPLPDGVTLDLAALPARLSIQANTTPATVGSVRFALDGSFRTDNAFPYALFGGTGGNFTGGTFTAGSHTLTATPFSRSNAAGVAGAVLEIRFNVV